MIWLIISLVGYFLLAIAGLTDKILLKKSIPEPVVYAFYISLLSLIALLLIPFGFEFPGFHLLLISFAAAFIFTLALLLFFSLLKKEEASRVIPLVSGLSPVFVFILSRNFLGESLSLKQILAFIIILIGGLLISLEKGKKKESLFQKTFFLGLIASFLFAVFYVLSKYVYLHHSFISGFIWIKIGGGLSALILFLIPTLRKKILQKTGKPDLQTGKVFIFGQSCGALSNLLINYAVAIGPLSLINALQGVQYGFLFLMILVFSRKFPNLLEEKTTPLIVLQKTLSIILISSGILLLFLKI
ncbi:hypothetical protein COW09_01615 [bacterium (Candidatus Moisslbacteria) CG12_big_fil_rev_8_21_14_0_65_36_11]|nr:EamA family transporter [Candidatus Kuenenbacteria bacterium]OIP77149.1 MAG: hypothetical protein AUK09_00475 [Parcubacteria group bacterium CG2_30_36_38]PIW67771.1 MAG: hypothetical protein COW09_01615 [bacterium (Candidatus Moisslbacteria) CG12_big_fil_rev_8_21_14_0_65_36_11]PIZ90357.1 MAG: hypothetical protein COX87_00920 [bacterium (Candidatus Moisslbacteria) CG_4_10_14_0_2_um_filter_36_61]